jgi:hypothetical protein
VDPRRTVASAVPGIRRGAVIDERTTVFNLGRMVHHLLDAPQSWRGSEAQASIVPRAPDPSPGKRFTNVDELAPAWRRSLVPEDSG